MGIMNLNDLLRGKTKEEIIMSICKKIDIPYDPNEADYIDTINKIVPIRVSDDNFYKHHFQIFNSEKKLNEDINIIESAIDEKTININEKIINWEKNYLYLLKIISESTEDFNELIHLKIKRDVVSNKKYLSNTNDFLKTLYYISNIFVKNKYNYPNIILMNDELKNYFPENINNFNIIFDKNINGIIIGRKIHELEDGLFLLKHKDLFKYYVPDKKLFIKINYDIIDENYKY